MSKLQLVTMARLVKYKLLEAPTTQLPSNRGKAWPEDMMITQRNIRGGFTLIELLIVVVIIGILAAIAIPKFASTKERSYVAKMKSDLRNLATSQEGYLADNPGAYYGGAVPNPVLAFNPSPGVTITITNAGAQGWAAVASYAPLSARTCALFIGATTPAPAPATDEGQIECN
jgi:prepilin-type N-terminal cleavage/methylation domain-containing protein